MKEPHIQDDMMSIVPDEDDMSLYHGKKSKKNKPQPDYAAKSASPASSILLVVCLAALGGLGFLTFTQYQQINQLTSQNEAMQANLTQINDAILSAQQSSGDSVLALNKQVNTNLSEIKKLWDVANKRNKKAIAKNQSQLAALVKEVKASDAQTAKALKSLNGSVAGIETTSKKVNTVESSVAKLSAALNELNTTSAKHQSVLNKHSNLLDALSASTTSKGLEGRVKDIELAISSIDKSRKQFNQRLNTLKGTVNDLKLSVETRQ